MKISLIGLGMITDTYLAAIKCSEIGLKAVLDGDAAPMALSPAIYDTTRNGRRRGHSLSNSHALYKGWHL